jgi:hypothetical protein
MKITKGMCFRYTKLGYSWYQDANDIFQITFVGIDKRTPIKYEVVRVRRITCNGNLNRLTFINFFSKEESFDQLIEDGKIELLGPNGFIKALLKFKELNGGR